MDTKEYATFRCDTDEVENGLYHAAAWPRAFKTDNVL